jgi:hypothetical protein
VKARQFLIDCRSGQFHNLGVRTVNNPALGELPADFEARAKVANTLLASCRPERYMYLAFAGVSAAAVLVALGWILVNNKFGLLEKGTLTSCSGLITVAGYRILRTQSLVFHVVFGTKL